MAEGLITGRPPYPLLAGEEQGRTHVFVPDAGG